jgi:hypothetical protein
VFRVAHNPHAVSPVRRANGASWNNKRPDGEAFSFQRCGNLIEAEANMSSNILGNDPSRPDLSNKAIHLRPEMSFIFFATPSSCHAEGLARVSPQISSTAPLYGLPSSARTSSWIGTSGQCLRRTARQ